MLGRCSSRLVRYNGPAPHDDHGGDAVSHVPGGEGAAVEVTAPFEILPTDWRFVGPYYIEEGEPDCICSRCRKQILEDEIAIRAWPADGRSEYRFHPECLGFETFDLRDDE